MTISKSLNKAEISIKSGDIQSALPILDEILLNPIKNKQYRHRALFLLSMIHMILGNYQYAIDNLEEAVKEKPNNLVYMNCLAGACYEKNDLASATQWYKKIIGINKDKAVYRFNLANVYSRLNDYKNAEKYYLEAIEMDKKNNVACYNLGNMYITMNENQLAIQYLKMSFERNNKHYESILNLAYVYKNMNMLSEAKKYFLMVSDHASNKIIEFNSRGNENERNWNSMIDVKSLSLYNIGTMEKEANNLHLAEKYYQEAIELNETFALARWNLSQVHLTMGKLKEGWFNYEMRFYSGNVESRTVTLEHYPLDSKISNKTILLITEQGLGDKIMFGTVLKTFINDMRLKNNKVILETDERLISFYTNEFPDITVRCETSLNDADYCLPLGSLPYYYRNTLSDFSDSYVFHAPDSDQKYWKNILNDLPNKINIGFCWRSGLRTGMRSEIYTKIDDWVELFKIPNINWVCLQYDECKTEIDHIYQKYGITLYRWDNIDYKNDLKNLSGLIVNLDLVISTGTAVAELSGMLGVPTWRLEVKDNWSNLGTLVRPWFKTVEIFIDDGKSGSLSLINQRLKKYFY